MEPRERFGAAGRRGAQGREGGAKPGQVAKVSDEPAFQTPQGPAEAALTATAALIAGRCGPLRVGDIEIDGQGRIRARDDKGPLRFAFAYRGVEFDAEVATDTEPRVRLSAELGKLPYSMEIGHGRHTIRRILMASALLPHGRIGLSDSDDMRLEAHVVAALAVHARQLDGRRGGVAARLSALSGSRGTGFKRRAANRPGSRLIPTTIPTALDIDPFHGAHRPAGQARHAARCGTSGKRRPLAPRGTRRADVSHPKGRALFVAVKRVNIKDRWYWAAHTSILSTSAPSGVTQAAISVPPKPQPPSKVAV